MVTLRDFMDFFRSCAGQSGPAGTDRVLTSPTPTARLSGNGGAEHPGCCIVVREAFISASCSFSVQSTL